MDCILFHLALARFDCFSEADNKGDVLGHRLSCSVLDTAPINIRIDINPFSDINCTDAFRP